MVKYTVYKPLIKIYALKIMDAHFVIWSWLLLFCWLKGELNEFLKFDYEAQQF